MTLRSDARTPTPPPMELLHGHVHRRIQSVLTDVLKPHGLTPIEWHVLSLLADRPDGLFIGEMADIAHVKSTFMTKAVQILLDKELVFSTSRARDRRTRRIAPREQARALVSSIQEEVATVLDALYAPLSEKERAQYHVLLQKIQGTQ